MQRERTEIQQEKEVESLKTNGLCQNAMKIFVKLYWLIIILLLKDKENVATSNRNITDQEKSSNSSQHVLTRHEKWSFPLRIYLANVTKSAVSGHIYWRNS